MKRPLISLPLLAAAALACADNGAPDVEGLAPKAHLGEGARAEQIIALGSEAPAPVDPIPDPTFMRRECNAGWVREIDTLDAATGAFELKLSCPRPSDDEWYLAELETLHAVGSVLDGRGSYTLAIDSFGWDFDDLTIPAQHVVWSFSVEPGGAAGVEHRVGTSDRGARIEGDYQSNGDGTSHVISDMTYVGGAILHVDAVLRDGPMEAVLTVEPDIYRGRGSSSYDKPWTAASPDDVATFDFRADGTSLYTSEATVTGSEIGFDAGEWLMTVRAETLADGTHRRVTTLDDPATAVAPDYASDAVSAEPSPDSWTVEGTTIEKFDDQTHLETHHHYASRTTAELGTVQTDDRDWIWDDETTDVVDQEGEISFDYEWEPDDHAIASGSFTDHFPGGGERTCAFTLEVASGEQISEGPFETVIGACR